MSRFVRLGETDRPPVTLYVDGRAVEAMEGDTLMVALLNAGGTLRQSEFGPEKRAGFCLMGACQDCWVWTTSGDRLRACSTLAASGQSIVTSQPGASWPNNA
ncbi:(2Fe-2S)-binding protein [Sphingomonas sp. VDB2]|uniref:(2Fe-2S)-binding protein n=1 Tax=Sphingomonas sp. VDB2 TaxID=3228751 RepID=UPI003A7F8EF6